MKNSQKWWANSWATTDTANASGLESFLAIILSNWATMDPADSSGLDPLAGEILPINTFMDSEIEIFIFSYFLKNAFQMFVW